MNHETAAARTTKGNKSVGDCQLAITAAAARLLLPPCAEATTTPRRNGTPLLPLAALFCRFFLARSWVGCHFLPAVQFLLPFAGGRSPADQTDRPRRSGGWQSVKACMRVRTTGTGRGRVRRGRDKVYDRERSSTSHHPRQMPARWSDANRGGGARGERFPSFGFIRTRTTVQHETVSRTISTNKGFPTQKNKQQWAQDPH